MAPDPAVDLTGVEERLHAALQIARIGFGRGLYPGSVHGASRVGTAINCPVARAIIDDDGKIENARVVQGDDEEDGEEDGRFLSVEDETIENQPKNKARVFRIRSLDQMLDETDRLARAHVEGDLVKWVIASQSAAIAHLERYISGGYSG